MLYVRTVKSAFLISFFSVSIQERFGIFGGKHGIIVVSMLPLLLSYGKELVDHQPRSFSSKLLGILVLLSSSGTFGWRGIVRFLRSFT